MRLAMHKVEIPPAKKSPYFRDITIRDWLAGQAMTTLLYNNLTKGNGEICRDAYAIADMMIEVGKNGG